MIRIDQIDYPPENVLNGSIQVFLARAYGGRSRFKFPKRWNWLYSELRARSYIARDGDAIVGHVGTMPFFARLNGQTITGAWSVDTLVLPEFRRQGIGEALQSKASLDNQCFSTVWCSKINQTIKRQIGHTQLGAFAILETSQSITFPDNCQVSSPDPHKIARSASNYLHNYAFYIERSVQYCEWRYVRQPFSDYFQISSHAGISLGRVCGFMQLNTGMVGDLFPALDDVDTLAYQLGVTAAYLRSRGCAKVRFGSANRNVVNYLLETGWNIVAAYPFLSNGLSGLKATDNKQIFLSLSDQDMDQFPW